MPSYDWVCNGCKYKWETFKKMSDPNPTKCPECGAKGDVEKHYSQSAPSVGYKDRPIWTYPEAKKFKDCRQDGGPRMKIDPSKHGDLGSWHSPGEIVPLTKADRIADAKKRRKKG